MRLTRSREDKILGGVCGGIARYLGVAPLLIRILFVLLALANGLGVLPYLVLWVVLPVGDPSEEPPAMDPFGRHEPAKKASQPANRAMIGGAVLVAVGLLLLLRNLGMLSWFRWDMVAPLMLIVIGAIVVLGALGDND